ncbi:MAG TPA: asparagine synthase (glutamine-hydrolyzing) [Chromatiales bacterium]|nr:asparagine synthase (glutamine-hydrolyzing) [Chromatiales bacterium]
MCGIAGFLDFQCAVDEAKAQSIVRSMADRLYHRGPDDSGVWCDAGVTVALAHRRLSIHDLNPSGHQPMISASSRYVIIFNGEIYNFQTLREELTHGSKEEGMQWRGHSDTEVMLAAIDQWGLDKAVQRFDGMFAFALWDRKKRQLHLVRDRMGEKPLYYGWLDTTLVFASELAALKVHPGWCAQINRDSLALYMRHNYVPAPYSIYSGIYKLSAGCRLTISIDHPTSGVGFCPHPVVDDGVGFSPVSYWSARSAVEAGEARPFTGNESEATKSLDTLLRGVVKRQMSADVPLGAFLSGGIDSSLIVALMQSQSMEPVKTFTIGFNEAEYNEAIHAKRVADHLGTDHTELYVSPQQAMAVIPQLPALYSEPFSDSSQIPTFLVSQMAKQAVTVSLSGDGGDELFAGYNRYFWGRAIWKRIGWMPLWVRHAVARLLKVVPPQNWDFLFKLLSFVLPSRLQQRQAGDKLHKLAEILDVATPEAMYLRLVSHWKDPASIILGGGEPRTVLTDASQWAELPDFTQRMMFLDMVSYLPDDILVKVDRASMGVSLESRVPMLDHRVVEFAATIPLSMKIRGGESKWLLRQVLYQYVPKALIERPKMGFGVPIDHWLRGPLRDWAEALLNEQRLRDEGFFNPEPIRNIWAEHLGGRHNWQYYLWDVLMFQAWLENEKNG